MRLPNLKYNLTKNQIETVKMGSINYSDLFKDGDIEDSYNISARRYPYISTRKENTLVGSYDEATSLYSAQGKLLVVEGTNLYYDGVLVGQVTSGEKQFATVNTKVVIWPDKVYLDLTDNQLKPLASSVTISATFHDDTITVSGLASYFKVGDGIKITGSSNNNITFTIKEIDSTKIVATNANIFTDETATATLSRDIPNLDFICESNNRLWGCSNEDQNIYASALGDPTNFNVFELTANDSYFVPVGSQGNFTGCYNYASTVLFWKEDKLHKILGSFPKEYTMYTYDLEGVKSGCNKSQQVINQILYYMGVHGVFRYAGSSPQIISQNFGEKVFSDAKGGEDGDTYYLSVKDGNKNILFAYETLKDIWVKEDSVYADDFTTIGNTIYMLSDGKVYKMNSNDDVKNMEWKIRLKPFYETIKGRKNYSKLTMRIELPKGSYIIASVSQDGKPFKEVYRLVGKTNNAVTFRLPITRCDKYEIELKGKGEMAILEMLREVAIESEV